MQGLHLTADLFDCAAARDLLLDRGVLQAACLQRVRAAALTVVGDDFHQFGDVSGQPGGVTGLVLLAESHLAVHTWPELNAVTLDVYVCNFQHDNSSKAQSLIDSLVALFEPARSHRNCLLRGAPQSTDVSDTPPPAMEWLTPNVVHGFTQRHSPATIRTPVQRLAWHDTHALGRLFTLDGAFMASEGDEFIYHECLVHVPALTHGNPTSAFIMGGGDGCTARELLRYPGLGRIVVAELDEAVVTSCREQFALINRGALDDPRVEVRIGDALATLREYEARYDLIVMDLTDPGTDASPANALYSRETYALIRSRLTASGQVTLHIGSAFYHAERFARTLADLRHVFPEVAAYKAFMPAYGCEWGLACAGLQGSPARLSTADVEQGMARHGLHGLRFYSPRVHASLFAWPVYAEVLGA
ncbi:MAG: adenosylmethionine decarboxylase [Burkholderiales bacterium]|nr:adenosylmethionine decarboxylase [Burkholderiales bacterium]